MKKHTTQNDRVLDYMRSHGGITSLEAYDKLGCTRLSARIKDLKEMGVAIMAQKIIEANCSYLKVGERRPIPIMNYPAYGQIAFA